MKKIILLLALICLLSIVNALEQEPYPQQEFEQKLDKIISFNDARAVPMLNLLKTDAVNGYSVFYYAYYAGDTNKVKIQLGKLREIFDEMNYFAEEENNFEEIYTNLNYWSYRLDYLIDKGVIEIGVFDENQNQYIEAIRTTTDENYQFTDFNKGQYQKPVSPDLLLYAVALLLVIAAVSLIVFIKKGKWNIYKKALLSFLFSFVYYISFFYGGVF